jgi:TrmH family RNA methyltransferase
MIQDICSVFPPKKVLVSHPEVIPESLKKYSYQLVSEEIIKKISGSLHPEGIIVEVELPRPQKFKAPKKVLILDKVSDPGNLGTLLRTALAFGWDGVFLIKGGCDPFNDKALRASKGALFHLPYFEGTWENAKELIVSESLKPVAADLTGSQIDQFTIPNKIALALGNEAHGLSDEIKAYCSLVTIPMKKELMESLNVAVAGGILMHRFAGDLQL